MITIASLSQLREQITEWKQQNLTIGFVPTMGNLHQGHLTLVEQAKQRADKVVVSIFVNPLQFDRAEDLATYPRTEQQDSKKLIDAGVDLLFLPTPETIYPEGMAQHTFVDVPEISTKLEGASRPGHFKGVSTIVAKLFNLVQPDLACFGEKDFQQLALIRKMVDDMAFPITIIGVPIVREQSGLAMSSRNNRLSVEEKAAAPEVFEVMSLAAEQLHSTSSPAEHVAEIASNLSNALTEKGFKPDGIEIVDARTLDPLTAESKQAVILVAAYLGKVRLIDNQVVDLTS